MTDWDAMRAVQRARSDAKTVDSLPECGELMPHFFGWMHGRTPRPPMDVHGCPPVCPRRLAREARNAKAVGSAEVSSQVADEPPTGSDANPVDSDGVVGGEADANPVDGGESIGDAIQRALRDTLAAPHQPSPPPVVSPATYVRLTTPLRPEPPVIRGVPQDPGPGIRGPLPDAPIRLSDHFTLAGPLPGPQAADPLTFRVGGQPVTVGTEWYRGARRLDGFTTNPVTFRAETPPSTAEAVARANAARVAAAARRRRQKARRVTRVAADRARGIRPCTHDCDRGDDW